MKWKIILLIFFVICVGSVFSGTIIVNSPNSGNTWLKGETYNITWTSTNCVNSEIKINIFKDSITVANFVEQLTCTDTGVKSWTIPLSYSSGQYILRVKTSESECVGDSGQFNISDKLTPMINYTLKATQIVDSTPKPDLEPRLDSLTYVENKHNFIGVIWNKGEINVNNVKVKLEVRGPAGFSPKVFYIKIKDIIQPGKRMPFNQSYIVPNLKQRESYNFIITADPNNNKDESNEGNNRTEFAFEFNPKADLVVCTSNNKRPRVGFKTQVHAIVKNAGYLVSLPCTLRFYIEKKGSNEYQIPALAPGVIHTITREVKWGISGTKTISAIVDYYKKAYEYREDNNTTSSSYFVRLPHHKKTTHPPYSICSDSQQNL